MEKITIYTDGACLGNPGIGGWGAVLVYADKNIEIYGGNQATTNQRMELQAAISALDYVQNPAQIQLFSDSQYLIRGMNEWLPGWKQKNWRNASGKELANQDLWQLLDFLNTKHLINWNWVKGHNGNAGNTRADQLANLGTKQFSDTKKNNQNSSNYSSRQENPNTKTNPEKPLELKKSQPQNQQLTLNLKLANEFSAIKRLSKQQQST